MADAADPDPDAVKRAIGQRPYAARVLTGTVPGASANRNTGWRAARSSLVLFTDNDTIPVPGFLGEHLRWHRQRAGARGGGDRAGAVGARARRHPVHEVA